MQVGLLQRRPAVGAAALVAGGLVLVGMLVAVSPIPFGYPLAGAATFVACLTSTSAFAVAALFHLRYERSQRVDDFLVALAFGTIAILEGTLPLVGQFWPATSTVTLWSAFTLRGVVSVLLLLAAWLPLRSPRLPTRGSTLAMTAAGLAALIVLSTLARISTLAPAVYGLPSRDAALSFEPSVLAFRLASCFLLAVAAIGFFRRARMNNDDVLRRLAIAALLLGVARVHDLLFPSLRSDWLTTADLLRMAAQILLVLGAYRALDTGWERRADEAADAERLRLAGDLHDGLAQDLAHICAYSQLASRRAPGDEHLSELAKAADRALTEARFAIAEFSRSDVRLDLVLADIAGELVQRHGREFDLELPEVVVESRVAYELARVGREAMTNAVRHASADRIVVSLRVVADQIELSVTDDGRGCVPVSADCLRSGFGMRSMQERVARLGGVFTLAPGPRRCGTTVRAAVPRT